MLYTKHLLPQLEETQPIFEPERQAHLLNVQNRLQRIVKWQQENDREFMAKRHSSTNPSKQR